MHRIHKKSVLISTPNSYESSYVINAKYPLDDECNVLALLESERDGTTHCLVKTMGRL